MLLPDLFCIQLNDCGTVYADQCSEENRACRCHGYDRHLMYLCNLVATLC